jgi:hypothetical protein
MGVSGGGGEPRCAFTVDVEAVELKRLTPTGSGTLSTGSSWCGPVYMTGAAAGGGKYCWWYSGYGFTLTSALPFLCGAFWNSPSLSGVSGPGESGSGFGAVPLRSANLEGCMDPSGFLAPYPLIVGLFGSFASKRARWLGEVGLGPVAFEPLLRPSAAWGGVAFFARSLSLRGVYLPVPRVCCTFGGWSVSGYGRGAVGACVGGAENDGMGGGREKAG